MSMYCIVYTKKYYINNTEICIGYIMHRKGLQQKVKTFMKSSKITTLRHKVFRKCIHHYDAIL